MGVSVIEVIQDLEQQLEVVAVKREEYVKLVDQTDLARKDYETAADQAKALQDQAQAGLARLLPAPLIVNPRVRVA